MAISTQIWNELAYRHMTESEFRNHYLQAPIYQPVTPQEVDLSRIEWQIQEEEYSHNFRIRWRIRELHGEFCVSGATLCDERNPDGFIRRQVKEYAERHCVENRIPYINSSRVHEFNFGGDVFWSRGTCSSSSEAEEKSRKLLLKFLSPKQREEFESKKSFTVTVPKHFGKCSGTYEISLQRSFNVHHRESGVVYCALPENSGKLPLHDILLSQKLMLESAPNGFLSKANKQNEFLQSYACTYTLQGRSFDIMTMDDITI